MTAIAAIRVEGVPVLLGDFLISSEGGRYFTRKKLTRLADNFAIGWTGNQLAASQCIKDLREYLGGRKHLSRATIERLLSGYDVARLGEGLDLHLLGWIVEGNSAFAFRWNSAYSRQLYYGEPLYDGTGSIPLAALFAAPEDYSPQDFHHTDVTSSSEAHILNYLTRMIVREMQGIEDWENRFGFGYEVLRFDRGRFRYIRSSTFILLSVTESDAGEFQIVPNRIIFHYRAFREISALTKASLANEPAGVYVMTSPGSVHSPDTEDGKDLERVIKWQSLATPPFKSRQYCLCFLAETHSGRRLPAVTLALDSANAVKLGLVRKSNNSINIEFKHRFLEFMFRSVERDTDRKWLQK